MVYAADEDYQGDEIVICFNGSSGIAILVTVKWIFSLSIMAAEGAYTHQGWLVDVDGYFNDELDEQYIGNNTRAYIMDVEDLDVKSLLGFGLTTHLLITTFTSQGKYTHLTTQVV